MLEFRIFSKISATGKVCSEEQVPSYTVWHLANEDTLVH